MPCSTAVASVTSSPPARPGRATQLREALARLDPGRRAATARTPPATKEARTTSRASSSDASSPSAIACTSEVPDERSPPPGPASTGRPAASAVHRQSSSFRAPPPTTWSSVGASPVDLAKQIHDYRVLEREALEDAAGDGARLLGRGLAVSAQKLARYAPACRPGPTKRASSGSMSERSGGAASASATSSSNERSRPSELPSVRRHSCSSQSPVTLRSRRKVPADAALVRQVGGEGLVVDQRLVELEADERPRAGADVGRVGLAERHGGDGRAGVVRRDARSRCAPSVRRRRRRERCRAVPADDLRQAGAVGMPRRSSRSSAQSLVRGSKHCVVVAFVNSLDRAAAEPVVEEVGDRAGASRRRRAPRRSPASSRRARRSC